MNNTNTIDKEAMRKRFEDEFSGRLNLQRLFLETPETGFDADYENSLTNGAWIGWQACESQFEQVVYADEDNLNIAPNIKPRYTFFVSTEKTYPFDTPLFTRKG